MDPSTQLNLALDTIIDECTECGGCMRQCAFLRCYGNPLQLATQYKEGALAPEVIYSCSLCRLCNVHCPEALDISDMFWQMRCQLVEEGSGPLKQHRRILAYEKMGLSRLLRSSALPEGADTIFYPGCAIVGTRPKQTWKLFELLKKQIPNLGMVLNCCAKPSHDLGRLDFFETVFTPQIEDLRLREFHTIITVCPSCHQIFSRYAEGFKVKTVYQILDAPAVKGSIDTDLEMCVHDPCSTRFEPEVHQSVRSIVKQQGITIARMKHQGKRALCCGEGGSASFVAPEITGQWAETRREQAAGRPAVTYCAGCVQFLSESMDLIHLVDLLLEPETALAGNAPVSNSPFTYFNRLILKAKLKRMVPGSD
ncbi:MAG: (Fe-S)-binding protein [Desulfofustis sp.]|nr:(Fe-S)-binding protein [Desulfofustis sp.]